MKKKTSLSCIKHITINKLNLHMKQRLQNEMEWKEERERERQECENFFSLLLLLLLLICCDRALVPVSYKIQWKQLAWTAIDWTTEIYIDGKECPLRYARNKNWNDELPRWLPSDKEKKEKYFEISYLSLNVRPTNFTSIVFSFKPHD